MKILLQTLLFLLLATQICSAQWQIGKGESRSEYPNKILSYSSFDIDSIITTTMNNYHLPGLSACIVRDGEIIWKGVYGYADIENNKPVTDSTLFKVASLSKPFVGTALMQLWENELLDLDEDINNHLPFQVRNPYYPNDSITSHMLVTHTSSVRDIGSILNSLTSWGGDSPVPLDSFLTNYLVPGGIWWNGNNYYNWAPLSSWAYSNVGAALAAHLVEKITNMAFEQYCRDSIFSPLGMNETSWFLSNLDTNNIALPYYYSGGSYHSYGHYGEPYYPAAGLKTSALQLARFIIAFMQKGQIDGIRILDSSTVDLMTTVQFPNLNEEQGIFWGIYEVTTPFFGTHTFCGHSGASYGVTSGMDYTLETDTHVGVIILSNGESQSGIISIWDALYDYSTMIPVTIAIININPTELDFGQVAIDSSETKTFTITNSGDQDLVVSDISSSDPVFTVNINSAVIPPDSSQEVEVTFTPTGAISVTGKIEIVHNAAGSPDSVIVRGNGVTGIEDESQPLTYSLEQNYPNPFNPSTMIKYSIPNVSKVLLKLYNVLGEEVATLVNEEKAAGYYKIDFSAASLPSGVYFYQLRATPNVGQSGDFFSTKKMILLK